MGRRRKRRDPEETSESKAVIRNSGADNPKDKAEEDEDEEGEEEGCSKTSIHAVFVRSHPEPI